MLVVRLAEFKDIPKLLQFSEEFVKHSGYTEPFDHTSTEQTIKHLISEEDSDIIVAASIDSEYNLAGFLGCTLTPCYWNYAHKDALEMFMWVDKGFRKQGVSKMLVKALERWGEAHNATNYILSNLAVNEDLEKATDTLYRKNGYEKKESLYYRRSDG